MGNRKDKDIREIGLPNVNRKRQLPVDLKIKLERLHWFFSLVLPPPPLFLPSVLFGHPEEIQKLSKLLSLRYILDKYVTLNLRSGAILHRMLLSFSGVCFL